MDLESDPRVKIVFDNYPRGLRSRILRLRTLVLHVAERTEGLEKLEETLKWGEPSYLTKNGSTVRMDRKKNDPECFAIYFKCTSLLVPTFKKLYGDVFRFEGDRAIVFHKDDPIPEVELKHCIALALTYHKVKHLPLLGA